MSSPRIQFSLAGLFAFTTIVAMAAYLGDIENGLVIAAVMGFAIICLLKAVRTKE